LPVDKTVEILRRTWYQGEDKSVDNPVEKLWIDLKRSATAGWRSLRAGCLLGTSDRRPRLPAHAFSIV
jgi:hypothetical protein